MHTKEETVSERKKAGKSDRAEKTDTALLRFSTVNVLIEERRSSCGWTSAGCAVVMIVKPTDLAADDCHQQW